MRENKMDDNVKACAECTQNCLLIHGKKKDPSPTITSFFKVMIGEGFSKALLLPPKFAPAVSALVGQKTQLEDSIGRRWIVTVSKINGSIVFHKGWHAFSVDHDLEKGDFLVFNYIRGSHFVVWIFEKSGCEKLVFSGKSQGGIANGGPSCALDKGPLNVMHSGTSVGVSHADKVLRSQAKLVDNGPAVQAVFVNNGPETEAVGERAEPSANRPAASGHLLATSGAEAASNGNSHAKILNVVLKECRSDKKRRDKHSGRFIPLGGTEGVSQKEDTSLKKRSRSIPLKTPGSSEFGGVPVSVPMQNCQFGRGDSGPKSSLGIKDNIEGCKVVKAEPVVKFEPVVKAEPVDMLDFSALDAISSVVEDGQSFLELPTRLPSISFKSRSVRDRAVVFLRDPVSRLWPVLYHEKYGSKVLANGWGGFSKANNLQPGDQCVFTVENVLESVYKVGIVRK